MPRKPAKKAAAKKAAAAKPKCPSYISMVVDAIKTTNDRTGVSAIAIEKFIIAKYKSVNFQRHFLRSALKRGVETGVIAKHHNHANSYKMAPKAKAPAKKETPAKKRAAAMNKANKAAAMNKANKA